MAPDLVNGNCSMSDHEHKKNPRLRYSCSHGPEQARHQYARPVVCHTNTNTKVLDFSCVHGRSWNGCHLPGRVPSIAAHDNNNTNATEASVVHGVHQRSSTYGIHHCALRQSRLLAMLFLMTSQAICEVLQIRLKTGHRLIVENRTAHRWTFLSHSYSPHGAQLGHLIGARANNKPNTKTQTA